MHCTYAVAGAGAGPGVRVQCTSFEGYSIIIKIKFKPDGIEIGYGIGNWNWNRMEWYLFNLFLVRIAHILIKSCIRDWAWASVCWYCVWLSISFGFSICTSFETALPPETLHLNLKCQFQSEWENDRDFGEIAVGKKG